jgi:uncharacterized protein YggT (Ycf19 family)
MDLLDFILNVVGLLLWFNWRAARFDPLTPGTAATLAGTLRRAEKSKLRRWHLPLGLLGLLVLRIPLYAEFGSALNWTGKVNLIVISIPFHSNTGSLLPMALYSFYSFGATLAVFLLWVLFLSWLKGDAPEQDSFRQLLRLHLGGVESWPGLLKLLLPFGAGTLAWYCASWPLTFWKILPPAVSATQRIEQAVVVGLGSYLAWRNLILVLLLLYFLHSYVYFGKHPFWEHLDLLGQRLIAPLRRLPLRWGRFDFAPLGGLILVILLTHIAEQGVEFPWGTGPDGRPRPRWIDLPGLVDWYRRTAAQ